LYKRLFLQRPLRQVVHLQDTSNLTVMPISLSSRIVLAVKKVLTALFFLTSVTFEGNEIRQKSEDQIDRPLEDLAIISRAFLTYLCPFQSYVGFKKLKRLILF